MVRRFGVAAMLCLGLLAAPHAAKADPIMVAGTTAGKWVNPVGPVTMVTSGVNTSTFTWGVGVSPSPPSSLNFAGGSFGPVAAETAFKLGTISYFNGAINADSGADSVDLVVSLTFTTPAGVNQSFDFTFQLINTPNVADPDAAADYVYLPSLFPSTIFEVDGVQYTLGLNGFENVTGDGFLTSNSSQFHVREGGSASAELWGKVTTNVSAVVPEPTTCAMGAIAGLAGLGAAWRRRKSA